MVLSSALLLFSVAAVSGAAPLVATWYGPGFEGALTASGEVFDPNDYTAASKTLAFGTGLIVTYNGASVVVRVNDRGPYANNADLDLSRAAADAVGLTPVGVATVDVVVADPGTPTGPYSGPIPTAGGSGAASSDQPAGEQYAGSGDAGGQDAGGQNGQEEYSTTTTAPGAGGANRDLPAVAPEPIRMVAVTTDRTDPGYAQGPAAEQYGEPGGTSCVPGATRSAGQYDACGEDTAIGPDAIPAEKTNTLTSCAPNDQYCGADQAEVQETTAAVAGNPDANAREQYPADTTQAQILEPEANATARGPARAPEPVPAPAVEEVPQEEAMAEPPPPVAVAAEETEEQAASVVEAPVPAPEKTAPPAPEPIVALPAPAAPEAEQNPEPEVTVEPPPPVAVAVKKTEEQAAPVVEAPVPAPETALPAPDPVPVPAPAPAPAPAAPEAEQSSEPEVTVEPLPPAAGKTEEQAAPVVEAPVLAPEKTAPPAPRPVAALAPAPAPKQSSEPEVTVGTPPPTAVSVEPPVVKSAGSEENVLGITELPRTGAPPIALPMAGGFLLGLGWLLLLLRKVAAR